MPMSEIDHELLAMLVSNDRLRLRMVLVHLRFVLLFVEFTGFHRSTLF